MSKSLIVNYLKKVESTYRNGNATEHSYRSYLKDLVETLAPGVVATNEPKRIKCGAPDFIITNKQTPLGYIETKDIGISLDQIERTDQMKRYLGSLANLILTDYVEFRWYVSGQPRMTVRLAKVGANHKLISENGGVEKLNDLLQGFMLTQTPTVSNSKELAVRMAALAQLIRNAINLAFKSEEGGGSLHTQMEGFKQVLLPDLTNEQFADMYAQTICYGLFAARCNAKPGMTFTREHAAYDIPKTNPFLRKMFNYIAGPDLDERIVWVVDDLAELLNRSDMAAILQDFGKRTRQEDPIVHFYETFLAQYDPKLRELRGVYYTPEPVVSYIVRSVDYLLKANFGLADGLADTTILRAVSSDGKSGLQTHKVQILDPATGTGTFLYYVIKQIYESFKDNKGMWSSYVLEHLLPRLFGFEILMAPYAVAHLKLGLQLGETGYDFRSNERLRVYLTNTLEEGFEGERLPFVEWLVEEATAAGYVKHDAPVMVVLGNPPYSISSQNKGKYIEHLMERYKLAVRHERNIQPLSDDYIKFIRFAHERIERTGYGVIGMITNHTYLSGLIHRGMREELIKSFSKIYILNLHGNKLIGEIPPDRSRDENVFDIEQGVSISLFVKHPNIIEPTQVYHADLWGLRKDKYNFLAENDISTTSWRILEPQATPNFFFVPKDFTFQEEYNCGWNIADLFQQHSTGFETGCDRQLISFTRDGLVPLISSLLDNSISNQEIAEKYDIRDTSGWPVSRRRRGLIADGFQEEHLRRVSYRPFDWRYTYYHDFIRRAQFENLVHLCYPNIALITSRIIQGEIPNHTFVAADPIEKIFLSPKTSNNAFVLPLYLYRSTVKGSLFDLDEPNADLVKRRSNFTPQFIADISRRLKMEFITDGNGDLQGTLGPEDIFSYMYAVLHSPTYRIRYAEFLKIDFPRLPLTSNPDLFRTLCTIGNRLVELHLMKKYGQNVPNYPEPGNNIVEKVEYTQTTDRPEQGKVWINKTQYFEGVSPEVWEFHVGGYQVCHKWLKDRKGHTMTYDERKHYQRIVGALAETIILMDQIDEAIDEHGGWPIT